MKKGYKLFASKIREDLYRSLKLISAAEGKSIQTLIEEAVNEYLEKRRFSEKKMGVAEPGSRYLVSFDISDNKKEKPKK